MDEIVGTSRTRGSWSTKKKVSAPRGVYRHPSGNWAIRFTCGAGHIHKERIGPLKEQAKHEHGVRRARARREPGWCPRVEERQRAEEARATMAREQARVTFADFVEEYLVWAKSKHRSYATTRGQVEVLKTLLGPAKLDSIATVDVERALAEVRRRQAPSGHPLTDSTVNRYRDRLSGMFWYAIHVGRASVNPVKGVSKTKEPGGRVAYLLPDEEQAILVALPLSLRPLFTVSIHTGLRWSEQVGLRWLDVDLHTGMITVRRSKHGGSRHVPVNSAVRGVLFDLSLRRERTDDPSEFVFGGTYTEASKFFPQAVHRAQKALKAAGKDASRLRGYTWHGNRHTFASRLVMAGVSLRAVQELGGWKSLKMVQRYSHLDAQHLQDAVERLVVPDMTSATLH